MQLNDVFSIWDRFESSKATEFVLETADGKLTLKKGGDAPVAVVPVAAGAPVGAAVVSSAAQTTAPAAQNTPQENAGAAQSVSGEVVKAPFVGTFYRASAPGAEPYIKIGQKVNKGDIVGIIEAMKMMNEIVAPCSGTVTEIYVEDENLVEFGQPLVCIGE